MFETMYEHLDTVPATQRQFILVVEDERASRSALSQLLRASGYETRVAESAEDALRLLRLGEHLTPAVALVDFNLPGMDGLELISQLQRVDGKVFAILITANDFPDLREQIDQRQLGYLRKPINFDCLLHLIRDHFPVP
jgi:two-component system, chemotaxis family, chemotaxis protein CheY